MPEIISIHSNDGSLLFIVVAVALLVINSFGIISTRGLTLKGKGKPDMFINCLAAFLLLLAMSFTYYGTLKPTPCTEVKEEKWLGKWSLKVLDFKNSKTYLLSGRMVKEESGRFEFDAFTDDKPGAFLKFSKIKVHGKNIETLIETTSWGKAKANVFMHNDQNTFQAVFNGKTTALIIGERD